MRELLDAVAPLGMVICFAVAVAAWYFGTKQRAAEAEAITVRDCQRTCEGLGRDAARLGSDDPRAEPRQRELAYLARSFAAARCDTEQGREAVERTTIRFRQLVR